jgi:endonuclease-3
MNPRQRQQFYARLAAAIPEPETELRYRSAYQLLVAVVLSAQATDRSVNEATRTLYREAGTPAKMVALGVDGVKRHIRRIGLFNTKAENVVKLSAQLIEKHRGRVPRERAALEALPGVGRKTANVVLNTAFGEPTMAVDTHIFRVANRTGIAPGKTPRQVEDGLLVATPPEFLRDAHHLLILHGRYCCTARKPECPRCPVADLCSWPDKTMETA